MKLCKCGAVVESRCERCYPTTHARTTKERGYGHDHREASEQYRAERPLCEVCLYEGRTRVNHALHHIAKIVDAPSLRMQRSNWLAVCKDCHEVVENDCNYARTVKEWNDAWWKQNGTAS